MVEIGDSVVCTVGNLIGFKKGKVYEVNNVMLRDKSIMKHMQKVRVIDPSAIINKEALFNHLVGITASKNDIDEVSAAAYVTDEMLEYVSTAVLNTVDEHADFVARKIKWKLEEPTL